MFRAAVKLYSCEVKSGDVFFNHVMNFNNNGTCGYLVVGLSGVGFTIFAYTFRNGLTEIHEFFQAGNLIQKISANTILVLLASWFEIM